MTRNAPKERILAVDDSPDTLEVLRRNLTSHGYQVLTVQSVAEAVHVLEHDPIDVVVTDLKMPGASGLELVRHVRENLKNTEVLMITGYPTVEGAVEAVKSGANDYLAKPFTDDELLAAVRKAFDKLKARIAMQSSPRAGSYASPAIAGECEAIRVVQHAVAKAADSLVPVLLSGERGVGKQLIARAIHYASARASAPFVVASCAGIPASRLADELFGAADTAGRGLVHAARGGTLYLEEIAGASQDVQQAIARLLRDKELPSPALGAAPDVRVIASSSRDLRQLVSRGQFREDLLYAVSVIEIGLPPLRDRGDDILLLARHFAFEAATAHGRPEPRFSDRSLQVLRNHSWPGNLQELDNTVKRLVVMADEGLIDVPDMPSLMRFSALRERGLDRSLADIEAEHIQAVLASVNGNQTRAAEILGIDRKTLREKIKRLRSQAAARG
ncbi:MAG TPA: sigma-54 dependent transcriptional regulator [Polyangiaceae bacterium]|nr:sigma-54 dependent transcriptional regulator [Polyangiaceae bacterium]